MKRKIEKYPLLYILAEQAIAEELKDRTDEKIQGSRLATNRNAQEFLSYIKSVDFEGNQDNLNSINERVYHEYISSDKEKGNKQECARNILQALSFNLTVQQACDIFPKTMQIEVPHPTKPEEGKKYGKDLYEEMYKLLTE